MHTTSTAGRSLAIAAGAVFVTGALCVLFEDVLVRSAPLAIKHYLTLVTIAGTMMTGHLADQARRSRHWLSACSFALVFLAGTGLVVYTSVGRQAETTMMSSAQHDTLVQKRLDLRAKLAEDTATWQQRQVAADTECKSGEGHKCVGARATALAWADIVAGVEARIEKLAPPKPVAPEAEQFGTVAAALGYDKERVKAVAMLAQPYLTTLFLEFGSIVSFGFAFSPKRSRIVLVPALHTQSETAQTSFAADGSERVYFAPDYTPDPWPEPDSPGPDGRLGDRLSKDEAERFVVTELALGRTIPSQDTLAERCGRPKSTVSDWLRDWENRRIIPNRHQRGRCKAITNT